MANAERIKLQPSFVLHRRDFRDSSQIVELFSRDHGRVAIVARGVKRPRSRQRGLLQPFSPLLVSWLAGRDLGTMTDVEQGAGQPLSLDRERLMCGFYLNELLLKLTHRFDAQPAVFDLYASTITALAAGGSPPALLREFERDFLKESGFGLNLLHEVQSGALIDDDAHYDFLLEQGPMRRVGGDEDETLVYGRTLRAIAEGDWSEAATLMAAQRILGEAIEHQLGGKPLHSRRILRAMRRRKGE